ncbi:MAG TPA: type II toxin-antitoxin system RelE/ParE family toxin [Jatrophihabitantaceae bacterium]|nr:type II toxin-antitoxin system RelE/ParE family toxin [Jatrophihabitantaceae bacterium]
MPRKKPDTARFERRYAPAVVGALAVLRAINARLVDAALAAVEDLAFGRQVGKLLGDRHVTGDLTGLSRLRFDVAGQHPLRFRIVYRLVDDDTVIEVLAIGERADHVVYRDTLARLTPTDEDTPDEPADE